MTLLLPETLLRTLNHSCGNVQTCGQKGEFNKHTHIYQHQKIIKPNKISLLDQPLCEQIPVLQPSCLYPCPTGRDHLKNERGLDVWKLGIVLSFRRRNFLLNFSKPCI